jgi:hypothetical protein
MIINYPPQSNGADFRPESLQFVAADDGLPVWADTPADLVATLTIKNDAGATLGQQTSIDGSGVVTVWDDGFVDLYIDDSQMAAFQKGKHTLFLKIATGGYTSQALIGYLPVYGEI